MSEELFSLFTHLSSLCHSKGFIGFGQEKNANRLNLGDALTKSGTVLKRNACGYRDIDYFKLRLFNLHNDKITRFFG